MNDSMTTITLDDLAGLLAEGGSGKRGVYQDHADNLRTSEAPAAVIDCEDESKQASCYQGFHDLTTKSKNKENYTTLQYRKIRTKDHPFAVAIFYKADEPAEAPATK